MITTYIGLGSNLKNPKQQIEQAISALQKLPQTFFNRVSSLYDTEPVGLLNQPNFINAVCVLHTQLSAQDLLTYLLAIEKDQGRIRNGLKNQPRTLDLDLLL